MMKLALVVVVCAAASLTNAQGPPCNTTDYDCKCTRLLGRSLGGGGPGGGGLGGGGFGGGGLGGGGLGGGGHGGGGHGSGGHGGGGGHWGREGGRSGEMGGWGGRRGGGGGGGGREGGRGKRHGGGGRGGGGGGRGQALTDCAQELGITPPPMPAWGSGTKPQLSDDLQNCLIKKGLTNQSLLTDTGAIKTTELATALTGSLTNNRWETLTTAQVDAIVNEVPACDTSSQGQTNNYLVFQNCLVAKCKTTLATP
ncbi:uncharacterized protein [Macrobrachium rosenbergii]|uniref:uncharacterized protein n=1 Tax=Macrobrachium rosenbergii TaxID=79674 RepID=UPI0034D4302C